jgi:hypothetical protein
MNRTRVFLMLVLAVGVALPAAALAHRRASKSERAAILKAVVRQHQLTNAQAACQTVTISTVNSRYATTTWPSHLSHACLRVAANGVIIEHKTTRGWTLVADGSDLHCPIKGVPARVARDLKLCA